MTLKAKSIREIAQMICGEGNQPFFHYRSSKYLTEFFRDCCLSYTHDGSSRVSWVIGVLKKALQGQKSTSLNISDEFIIIIRTLMDRSDNYNEDNNRVCALKALNITLGREGLQAFYDNDKACHLRHIKTQNNSLSLGAIQRAWTKEEKNIRDGIEEFIDISSEDKIIEKILLPLFRHLGFQKITPAGHQDKSLEYGKDIWMKYRLPTAHNLYFGIQVKKGKLDASGRSKNTNMAEVLNQIEMMLGNPIFDPDTNKKHLVDHAIIVAGGEITKQARNWLAEKLDQSKRSQILFTERRNILDLILEHHLPLDDIISNNFDTI